MALPFTIDLRGDWFPAARLASVAGTMLTVPDRAVLTCSGSLTRHLEESWGRPVGVRLAGQRVVAALMGEGPHWGEGHRPPGPGPVLLRDAWLDDGLQERVFAHSQMAVAALPEPIRAAIQQGERPLGTLFTEQELSVQRALLELARARVPYLAGFLGVDEGRLFWCRRSLFAVDGKPQARILEIFLREHPG
ncbi:MAG: chorismate lyase [Magnetococcales bacterium]|nr:chorismate lyase [Magnetococcales bacterium]